ncbi:hypothetical protein SLEP1_g2355 [Rubroshorea leprosula]|uniref:Uncharacterized protein n=1 Tax=Rubroshorea leprosula TaxID=152421 RepID=A0AAV5HSQ6_9ROSI|nr:hypothetical protein SLEP1_g2355 [Rubroshorea leprosula]
MYMGIQFVHVTVIILLLFGSLFVNSMPCDEGRCRPGSRNSSGACIFDLPDPSIILDGDRLCWVN